jgi:hypothetical protein
MLRARPLRTLVVLLLCSVCVFSYYWRSLLPLDAQNALSQAENSLEDTIRKTVAGVRGSQNYNAVDENAPKKKVALEAHIMSKCPDARICLHNLVVPAMTQIFNLVDFKLSFIGTATDMDDGVECKHGPQECLGNILILCAAQRYPVKQYLGFAHCMIDRFPDIPQRQLVSNCASEYGMDMSKLNDCASDSTNGMQLLRRSVTRSKAAGVATSCTVRLDNKKWCVVDGGKWKECGNHGHKPEDLVDAIKRIASSNHS